MRIVLGIDPGYDRLGVALIKKDGHQEELIYSDCFLSNKKAPLSKRLFSLGDQVEKMIKTWQPTEVAMEKLYFTVNQKTALAVAESRGMISYLCARYNLPLSEYTPTEIKLTIAGYGRADKKQINEMIKLLLKKPLSPKFDDEMDAIAIALTSVAKTPLAR
ncbi:MAG: crossover junction endodeoxyribonuclease RuvC [Candidatus Vogelbacteria bacterium CG10_big_fil_rev_8_21_14_0_10_49_38]|uniref:Crossover junction endodeoxyribonuclease RuvC n=1 Tax=Candidatus Vogelbacteria bacterium CG10_big_fil_rev_8_21_14_0_10_49_38 TaxID=1975043 RepID=A0A2H0RIY7_9BACT|nr:MAG: crossover junction endodeoxyribonuclease RuvC [bacterium CG10_49_38]PIR45745.1 MAG: crossover junction endodeoxyribonuclease RuvC [Candidatus Vogelbacteria bacterium CG10_big_fil_rev_8_21_14_0_10_49_38]